MSRRAVDWDVCSWASVSLGSLRCLCSVVEGMGVGLTAPSTLRVNCPLSSRESVLSSAVGGEVGKRDRETLARPTLAGKFSAHNAEAELQAESLCVAGL